MARPRHILETYIKATPEQIWHALTDPDRTRLYFSDLAVRSGWEPGDAYAYDGQHGPAVEGVIEEIDPPRRLTMTFRMVFTPELAAEPPSRVTWEITPVGDACRVTLVHGDLGLSPATWQETATGWGIVMAGLKSVVETGRGMGEVPDDGRSPFAITEPDTAYHRTLAIETNHATWDLLGRTDRNEDDAARLVHVVHASAYHWSIAGDITNWARAEYLCSRVYSFLGRAEPALHHASRGAALTAAAGLGDFDLAYVHEAMARALACAGRLDEARVERDRAAAVPVADDEDRAILEGDLRDGPWFGLPVLT